ncbi:DUF6978 family protein [Halobellus sp. GM3]|uniref:DUF6978 family protein n=1 Tax=Halobellus sp. GM3 TaxID=3458410 RepID=UPI00403D69ED
MAEEVTRQKIEELHEAAKVIEEDWEWEVKGSNMEGEAIVYCLGMEESLTLKAWKRKNYGFALLYKGAQAVRRWDDGVHHTPDGTVEGSHKHYWNPPHEHKCAYEVNDISTDDVDEAFHDFLEEENIELQGDYVRQTELGNV